MPRYPPDFPDPERPAGRFNTRAAIAIGLGEFPDGVEAEKAIREGVGDWVLEEHPELGRAEALGGSAGRGAEGWVAVVQWVGEAIANNVVDITVGYGLAKTVERLREWKRGEKAKGERGNLYIPRGTAALLAAVDVAESFGDRGPLEVEAVEEPAGIAGYEPTEISYVGFEPWIALLRNVEKERRYIVVVRPDGEVAGRLMVPFLEFEAMFLRPSLFTGGQG